MNNQCKTSTCLPQGRSKWRAVSPPLWWKIWLYFVPMCVHVWKKIGITTCIIFDCALWKETWADTVVSDIKYRNYFMLIRNSQEMTLYLCSIQTILLTCQLCPPWEKQPIGKAMSISCLFPWAAFNFLCGAAPTSRAKGQDLLIYWSVKCQYVLTTRGMPLHVQLCRHSYLNQSPHSLKTQAVSQPKVSHYHYRMCTLKIKSLQSRKVQYQVLTHDFP